MRPERTPVLQYTTISSAVLSSFTRDGTWATGIRTALSRRAISHSIGSPTTRGGTALPPSLFSFRPAPLVLGSPPPSPPGSPRPPNSSSSLRFLIVRCPPHIGHSGVFR